MVRRAVSRPEVAVEAADVSVWRPGEWVLCGSSEAVLRLRRRIAEVSALPAPALFAGEVGSGREAAALVLHDRVAGASRPIRTVRCATARPGEVVAALRSIADGDPAFWLFADLEELSPADVDPAHWREATLRSAGPPRVAATVGTGAGSEARSTVLAGRWPGWSVVPVPPLARRREDLRALVSALLGRLNREEARGVRGLDAASLAEIERRSWPGNLRELANVLRAAALRSRSDVLTEESLAPERQNTSFSPQQGGES
jgi:DNA-binding NtrC family response regulator